MAKKEVLTLLLDGKEKVLKGFKDGRLKSYEACPLRKLFNEQIENCKRGRQVDLSVLDKIS